MRRITLPTIGGTVCLRVLTPVAIPVISAAMMDRRPPVSVVLLSRKERNS